MSLDKANIKCPVDIQDQLEIYEGLWAADGTAAQTITCDTRGYGTKQFTCLSNTAGKLHIWTISYSFDNVTWYVHYASAGAELSTSQTVISAARYWKVASDAVVGAHTEDLIIGAVP
jgi:hypothetical protein